MKHGYISRRAFLAAAGVSAAALGLTACGAAGSTAASVIISFQAGPKDADFRIVPSHAAFIIGMPEVIDFIAKFSDVTEDQKSVSKALRNQELLLILSAQFYTVPLSIGL